MQVVGDDYLVTSAGRIAAAAAAGACNAVLLKPNQAGTITETKAALDAARAAGWSSIVSARSGETEDVTIVHLAVGWAAGQLKVGSCARSERTAKWNEALRIEESLGDAAVSVGCLCGTLSGRKARLEQEIRRSEGVHMKKPALGMLAFILLSAGVAWSQGVAPVDQFRPSPWRERFSNPRIEALRKEIASGRATTDAFWSEVAKEGTPLIEPSNEGDKHQLLTFCGAAHPTRGASSS